MPNVAAAGPVPGFVELPQQATTDKSRLSLAMEMPDALSLKFTVPLVTIADLMDQHKIESVALIKIDVEGFELSVLRGLRDRIFDRASDSSRPESRFRLTIRRSTPR
jgi:FkbM family methyltransferase